jgi:putative hydrolase of the HAD superfamily
MRAPRAIFFDAGMTLLHPAVPVADVYFGAARDLGADLEHDGFARHLSECWRQAAAEGRHRGDELRSSEAFEREFWRLFTLEVARPFEVLQRIHGPWFEALVRHFDSPDAWVVADGALDVLAEARRRGWRTLVVSNWHRALHAILETTGLRPHFDHVLVSSEVGWRKPHPAIFERALALAGVAPADAIHVGDSPHDDVQGARRAGIRPVLIGRSEAVGVERIETLGELARVIWS